MLSLNPAQQLPIVLGIVREFADLILGTELCRFLLVSMPTPREGVAECIVWRNGQSGPFLSLEVDLNREREKHVTINHSALGIWYFGSDNRSLKKAKLFFNETIWENAPRA